MDTADTSSLTPSPSAPAKVTVLVADDEPVVRIVVAESLADAGHRVLEAESGETALELLRAGHRINLLITDIHLAGGLDGRDLADRARKILPDLKVIFMTGDDQVVLTGRNAPQGHTRLLTKPFRLGKLGEEVSALLQMAG
jgi:CheY-like chemotaxis protein